MFVEMWGFRRLLLSSNARIISNAPYACGAGFQLSLLNSISVIISGFSFCLRRGTFVGRKYPKASAFLKESSQRTKNIFPCCPSPVSLSRRCSEFSMVVLPRLRRPACAFAPRTPCFILLAPFYQRIHLAGFRRRRLKSEDRINSRRNRSGGSWVKVFLFFSLGFSFLFASFLFSFLPKRKEKEENRHSLFASISLVFIRRVVLPLSFSSSFILISLIASSN